MLHAALPVKLSKYFSHLAKSINGLVLNRMEEENTPTKTFIRVAVPENICLQCGKLVDNPALRRKLFSGKQKTKTQILIFFTAVSREELDSVGKTRLYSC